MPLWSQANEGFKSARELYAQLFDKCVCHRPLLRPGDFIFVDRAPVERNRKTRLPANDPFKERSLMQKDHSLVLSAQDQTLKVGIWTLHESTMRSSSTGLPLQGIREKSKSPLGFQAEGEVTAALSRRIVHTGRRRRWRPAEICGRKPCGWLPADKSYPISSVVVKLYGREIH